MQKLLLPIGILIMIMGTFWACQGYGLIQWPASSFMVNAKPWVTYGLITAAAGLMIALLGLRK